MPFKEEQSLKLFKNQYATRKQDASSNSLQCGAALNESVAKRNVVKRKRELTVADVIKSNTVQPKKARQDTAVEKPFTPTSSIERDSFLSFKHRRLAETDQHDKWFSSFTPRRKGEKKENEINFRKEHQDKTDPIYREIKTICKQLDRLKLEIETSKKLMDKMLEKIHLLMSLIDNQFRETNQLKTYFLQSLFYYLSHTLGNDYCLERACLLKCILFKKKIFNSSKSHVPSYWVDDKTGFTALHALAISKKFCPYFNSLLKRAFTTLSPEDFKNLFLSRCRDGFTLLNAAAKAGNLIIVQALLAHAEKMLTDRSLTKKEYVEFLQCPNTDGFTSLIAAAKEGHLEIVQTLLAHAEKMFKAKLLTKEEYVKCLCHSNNNGFTVLITAVNAEDLEIVQALLIHVSKMFEAELFTKEEYVKFLRYSNTDGFTALNSAAKAGNLTIVQALLLHIEKMLADGSFTKAEYVECLWHPNNDGFTPLLSAAKAGNLAIVQTLLAHAEKMFINKSRTLFTKEKYTKFLLYSDNYGFTALNSAAKEGHLEIVQALLAYAEKMFEAKLLRLEEYVKFLQYPNNDGFTALIAAAKKGHPEIVQALLAHAEKMFEAKLFTKEEYVEFLLHSNKDGFTPLIAAAKEGNLEIVQALLAHAEKMFINKSRTSFTKEKYVEFLWRPNHDGFTALNAAVKAGHLEIVRLLLTTLEKIQSDEKRKEVLDHQNKDGFTALNGAALSASRCTNPEKIKRYKKICKLLLSAGADPDLLNCRQYSARINYPDFDWGPVKHQMRRSHFHSRKQMKKSYRNDFFHHYQKIPQSRFRSDRSCFRTCS